MNEAQSELFAAMNRGLEMAIVHIFNCLHQRGVLTRDEAAASLEATAAHLEGKVHFAATMVLGQIVRGIRQVSPDPQGPTPGPTAPIRPTLTVIQGGRKT